MTIRRKHFLFLSFLLFTALSAHALTITSNTTWTKAQSPVVLNDSLRIDTNGTLNIEPGVVVKVGAGFSISALRGRIKSMGTKENPVIFTSIKDDAVDGVDSNGDGNATVPAPGDWAQMLIFQPGAGDIMNHTFIRYGGRTLPGLPDSGVAVFVQDASPVFTGGGISYAQGNGLSFSRAGEVVIDGFEINQVGSSAVRITDSQVGIYRSLITAGRRGLDVSGFCICGITASSITFQSEYGILDNGVFVPVQAINNWWGHASGPLDDSDDRASGGSYNPTGQGPRVSDRVVYSPWLTGPRPNPFKPVIDTNTTWQRADSPIIVTENAFVRAGATLTIEPGVVVKFKPGTGLRVEEGSLLSQGTNSNHIIFTSIADDAADGVDSNGDSSATQPEPGNWDSVSLNNVPATFDYTEFRYGGAGAGGMLRLDTSRVAIKNSSFLKSNSAGLAVMRTVTFSSRIENCIFSDNQRGVFLSESRSIIEFQQCSFVRNRLEGFYTADFLAKVGFRESQFIDNGSFGAVVGSPLDLVGNVFDGNQGGIHLLYQGMIEFSSNSFRNTKSDPVFGGVPVVANLAVQLNEVVPNSFETSNQLNAIAVFGENSTSGGRNMTASGHLKLFSVPYLIMNESIVVRGDLSLTVDPGVVIKIGGTTSIKVAGAIRTNGTSAQPVIFTSINDDTVGGDTNRDGNAIQPKPGDWSVLEIGSSSSSAISYTEFRYGGGKSSNPNMVTVIANTAFTDSRFTASKGNGVRIHSNATFERCLFDANILAGVTISETPTPIFTQCRFENQPYGIQFLNGHVGTIAAENNWWGHETGPLDDSDDRLSGGFYNPGGQGVRVPNFVDYIPWVGMAEVVPGQVTGATVTYQNDGRTVQIAWANVPDAANYSVLFSTDGTLFSQIGVSTSSPATHQPSAGPARFYYAVAGLNQTGTAGPRSTAVDIASPFTPVITAPADQAVFFASTVVVQGVAQVGTRVLVRTSSGTELGSVLATSSGTFAVPIILGEGTHLLTATTRDATGRDSTGTPLRTLLINLPPAQLAAPTAAPGDTTITLSWPAAPDTDTAGYWIYRDGNTKPLNAQLIAPVALPQFTDIGLTNARAYSYRLAVQDAAGNIGPKSDAVNAAPVAGPKWGGVR